MFSLYKELCLGLRMFIPQYSFFINKASEICIKKYLKKTYVIKV